MSKTFNVDSVCIPKEHYMVDITNKLNQVIKLIEQGKYFVIDRPRQYGKTTMLNSILTTLRDKYYVIILDFEKSETIFDSYIAFCQSVCKDMYDCLEQLDIPVTDIKFLIKKIKKTDPLGELGSRITKLCKKLDKPIVMLVDEIDKNSNNKVLLGFLSMLRGKYIGAKIEKDVTFKSVILAGVYDIKNLKLKFQSEDDAEYNSPWNIATTFDVDMSFNSEEIGTMLLDYENDYHLGINIEGISDEIYYYTNGYPFLVSKICKVISEKLADDWSKRGVQKAIKLIVSGQSTLLDDIIKNIRNYPKFGELVEKILVGGETIPFNRYNTTIARGLIFGILAEDTSEERDCIKVSNKIFEIFLYDYFISTQLIDDKLAKRYRSDRNQFIEDNKLNMEQVLLKFQEFIQCEYTDKRKTFLEDEGRLLFLCFLKPIINGTGFYYVEPQTRDMTRMDIVVTYGEEEHIIELKIWHGDKLHKQAYTQLLGYLNSRNQSKGYLLTFSFNNDKKLIAEWNNFQDNKQIFEVTV